MDWTLLIQFIEAHQPGFSATLTPAAPAELTELRRRCPAPLPGSYSGFLERMGRNTGALRVLSGIVFASDQLVAQPHARATFDTSRYMKIGIALLEDGDGMFLDRFLDLATIEADDAEMVLFEDHEDLSPRDRTPPRAPRDSRFTFGEFIQHQAFFQFRFNPSPHKVLLSVTSNLTDANKPIWEDERHWWREVMALVGNLGLFTPLTNTERLWFGVGQGTSVVVRDAGEKAPTMVFIGSDERGALVRLVELFRDNMDVVDVEDDPFFFE